MEIYATAVFKGKSVFIEKLNDRQQGILLDLGKKLIAADGNIHDKEAELLNVFRAQMSPSVQETASSNLAGDFQTQESKAALLLEILGLAHADEEYHLDEKSFVSGLAKEVGLDSDTLADMESWVLRQFALVREAQQFLEG